uniref:Cytochrome c biogenesis protein ResB n=1 Tax=Thermodesulfovibrio aggregans TaxID=86166 RepID=A0A7C4EKP1_9BACT
MLRLNRLNEKVWNFFASVDLAVALFIVISIGAAAGTIIPQQVEPEATIRFFSKFLPLSISMNVYEIVSLLDLNNVYHSWWFTFLLFMFALNLIVCSIDRLPLLIKSFKTPPRMIESQSLEKMPGKHEVELSSSHKLLDKLTNILKRRGYSIFTFNGNKNIQIHCRKWSKTRLAVYLTHLSILIILSGALIGTFFGFRGSMNIIEGTGSNIALSDDGRPIYLPFEIVCDRFEVEFYENSAVPKAYRSHVRLIENGQTVKIKGKENFIIEVNQPLTYRGITFYQATYGFQPAGHAEFRFTFFDKSGKEYKINSHFEEKFKIPESSVTASVIDFSPALGVDEQGRLFNMDTNMINPAVLVEFEHSGKKSHQWILARIPESWDTPFGKLKFNELWGAQFTGLQIRRDPGVPLIYTGSILLCIGLFICLFLKPSTYFIELKDDKISFFYPSSKGAIIMEKEIDKIIQELKGEKDK